MEIETELLPPLPTYLTNADDWVFQLSCDDWWTPVVTWGRHGWDLGRRPYVAVAHFDGHSVWALAQFVEGDVTVAAFNNRAERDAYTDGVALVHWRQFGNGPNDLPGTVEELPAPLPRSVPPPPTAADTPTGPATFKRSRVGSPHTQRT